MNNHDEIFWLTSGWDKSGWLGIRATWDAPLGQAEIGPSFVDKIEADLLRQMQEATEEGIRSIEEERPQVRAEIHQLGPAAEDFHGLFVWLEALPRELVLGSAVRGLAAVVGFVKGRVDAYRIEHEGGLEITASLDYHPDLLAALALEHAQRHFGVTTTHDIRCRSLSAAEKEQVGEAWPPKVQYWVEILGDESSLTYRVDESGTVHELTGMDTDLGSFSLIPDVNPIPVPPFRHQDSRTDEWVTAWPAQDGVDRSEQIAIIASAWTRGRLEAAVRDAVEEVLPDSDLARFKEEHYQIGPMAGGIEHFIVELFQAREVLPPIVGNLSEAWVIYEIASRVAKKFSSRSRSSTANQEHSPVFFSPPVLANLCEYYVRANLHPRAKLQTEWKCLTNRFYGGYQSPSHPTASVEYLVTVDLSDRCYRFRIRGDGEVLSLFMKQGRRLIELATPTLFEDKVQGEEPVV